MTHPTPRRLVAAALIACGVLTAPALHAQARKDSVVLGMVLEPAPGLEPTSASAAAPYASGSASHRCAVGRSVRPAQRAASGG